MDMEWSDSRPERSEGRYDDLEENGIEKSRESSKHRSKESKKSSRREEKDHRTKDKDRTKTSDASKEREKEPKDLEKDRVSSRERKRDDRDERDKEKNRDKIREKDHARDKYRDKEDSGKLIDRERDKDRKREKDLERDRETEKDSDRGRDKERGKEKNRDKDKERDRTKEREREKEREKYKDREKERDNDKDRDRDATEREKGYDKTREKERGADHDKERSKDRDRVHRKNRDEGHDKSKDDKQKLDGEDQRDRNPAKKEKGSYHDDEDSRTIEYGKNAEAASSGSQPLTSELGERISKMKEGRLKNKSEAVPELLAWVNKSRKLEEKRNAEKERAMQLSKIFEEQDNIDQGESEDEEAARHTSRDLAGVKILHGLDKVMEGGAVVLTLKDQDILADGDVNEEVDMLENVELGQQKQRDEAYKAAKKKTGIYEDKFNDDPSLEKRILPQYDDLVADEGVTLDERGRFTGEAEKKLEELRRRIQGVSSNNLFEDLSSSGKITSDYYTHEEMLQFKKPKKKKSLRKKDKLDLDALEAEALSAGLGVGDLARKDGSRQAIRKEKENFEAEKRSSAYQSAYAKADEASKALRLEQNVPVKQEEDENPVFAEDDNDDDLYKSLERARNLALKKQNKEATSGPQSIALLATTTASTQSAEDQNAASGEPQDNKVVFTEMEEFVWGLQLDEESHKPGNEDVFMEEDDVPNAPNEEIKDEAGGWTEIKETDKDENPVNDDMEDVVPDETIHEVPVGKGLSGALKLLKERGTLKETVEWGGRNMDKKKSKLVGIYNNDGEKEIRIERTDEFGRIMTPKEAFRMISHKFHGKGPGKMKQEKRMKQYQEELKLKQMKNSDTPSHSVERMREAQARSKMPYVVLSGHVKPGQTSDPRSGFATVEKDLPGGLTPMLGDRKVEHFLGIKRNAEPGDMGPPKRPRT